MGLLVVAGTLAGILPSWRAARLPIAATLREEAVA
jgi:ABC-type lipoprotein release transport system permease subunit